MSESNVTGTTRARSAGRAALKLHVVVAAVPAEGSHLAVVDEHILGGGQHAFAASLSITEHHVEHRLVAFRAACDLDL